MELMSIDYNKFNNEFRESCRILTRENTKHETIVRIGTWLNQDVALKSCREQEAMIYCKIKPHPNIVKLLSVIRQTIPDKKNPQTYILMEGNDGITLVDTVIYKYNLLEALHIMIDITKGLQHLHNLGIIHHDIKKSNILQMYNFDTTTSENSCDDDEYDDDEINDYNDYDEDEINDYDQSDRICECTVFKICDFGLSELVDDNGCGSERYRCCGTKSYMAPEKIKGSNIPITVKVDIFAIGVLGSSLISPDESSTNIDKYNNILTVCQAIDPNERYTAGQLLEQLIQLQTNVQRK